MTNKNAACPKCGYTVAGRAAAAAVYRHMQSAHGYPKMGPPYGGRKHVAKPKATDASISRQLRSTPKARPNGAEAASQPASAEQALQAALAYVDVQITEATAKLTGLRAIEHGLEILAQEREALSHALSEIQRIHQPAQSGVTIDDISDHEAARIAADLAGFHGIIE